MYNQDVHMNYSKQPGVVDGVPANTPPNYYYNENPQRHMNPQHQHMTPWSSGLCDCCSDVKNCCITCWCPCITFGQIAEIVDQGTTSCAMSGAIHGLLTWVTGCGWIYSCLYRSKLRKHYMLEERPCNDCLVHFCCECCALCQEYRELESRGFDMSIGWHENVARQNRGVAMASAPVIGGTMTR